MTVNSLLYRVFRYAFRRRKFDSFGLKLIESVRNLVCFFTDKLGRFTTFYESTLTNDTARDARDRVVYFGRYSRNLR